MCVSVSDCPCVVICCDTIVRWLVSAVYVVVVDDVVVDDVVVVGVVVVGVVVGGCGVSGAVCQWAYGLG